MIEQGTPEWHQMRLGKVTASRVKDVIANGRGGKPSTSRANYLAELLLERLTGNPAESYTNAAMQWGNDNEPRARSSYEFEKGVTVEQVAFVDHPSIAMSGASPDGKVGEDGLVEIKCPNSATHLDTLKTSNIKGAYITQMQWQMACTGRKWCDFVSFDPRFPAHLQMHVIRVKRDQSTIIKLETEVSSFLREVEEELAALQTMEKAS